MRAMHMLSFVASLICAYGAVAQETDTHEAYPKHDIDEVVVSGVNPCGSWPIEHYRLKGCDYVELRKEDLSQVLRSRQEFFSNCLKCLGSRCTMKAWPEEKIMERFLCKRLFRTPTRVPRFMSSNTPFSPFRVSFTFSISAKGKVEDIELVSFDGDIDEAELLRLIEEGAAKTRFEPIIVGSVAYQLAGLRDKLIMDDASIF